MSFKTESMTSLLPSSCIVRITHDEVLINDAILPAAAPPSHFYEIFGTPDRVLDKFLTPAPHGHRNNQRHYYDDLGITLNEHHYTHQIQAINFVLDTEMAHHPTKNPFRGSLQVAGATLNVGAAERALAASSLKFTSQLSGTWFAMVADTSSTPITIAVTTMGPKLPSGRCSRAKLITNVELCLTHDPWDTTYRTPA